MAYTTIDNPELYFQTLLHVGNNTSFTFAGSENMQPDLIWNKNRDSSGYDHHMIDSVRGVSKLLRVSSNIAEFTSSDSITAIGSDGFTVGADSNGYVSSGTDKQVSWCWKAGGSASSNSDGSITSSVSANTTAGFSIVSYTGNGTAGATVGHGLGSAPTWVLIKNRTGSSKSWQIGHQGIGFQNGVYLNLQDASSSDNGAFNSTAPSSSVFTLGTSSFTNTSSDNYISYCFAEKKGYSKFFSYEGNSNSDGTFVYLGFRPAWLMVKPVDASDNYVMFDNKRHNAKNSTTAPYFLYANKNFAETTDTKLIDLLSNGFKIRSSGNTVNRSSTFVGIAFAESSFVNSNGVPNNAR